MLSIPTRRFLVRCALDELPQVFTDALVIGSGGAGLRAAIELSDSCHVILVTKRSFDDCATQKAQGGVAIAVPSAGGVEGHIADTIAAGDGLCDEEAARKIVSESIERVEELVSWGAAFDREGPDLALTREGGHSGSRIVHARGDATGREVGLCLLRECSKRDSIRMMEICFIVDLIADGDRCYGALVLDQKNELKVIRAAVTILATGGCGQVYRETTSPEVSTGDGLAMAYRAGAVLTDMEFVQFHPTTLYVAGAARALISEVLRGEGGILINAQGERFMDRHHPDAELASRDIVSRGVLAEMRRTNSTHVFLDITHLPDDLIRRRFPEIRELCARFDIDIHKDPIPVRPAVHYMMGGIRTDLRGRTGICGLYACGEVACTGFHGANRLGSNSLLETFVMGRETGSAAAEDVKQGVKSFGKMAVDKVPKPNKDGLNVTDVKNSLQSLMAHRAGMERDEFGLSIAKASLEFWTRYVMERDFEEPAGWEIQNMLTVARLIVEAALARKESRGAHRRTDHPERSDEWLKHLCQRRGPEENGT